MADKIRFAIIGASGIAPDYINAINYCSKAEGRYIFSRDFNRANDFAIRFGLIPTKSYEEILNNRTIDAVIIITEPHRHAQLALEAIKYGKHVLIEKPLDVNISLAKQVLEKSEKSHVISSVISQNRFDPVFLTMKKKLKEGIIGKPYLAEIKILWKRSVGYYQAGNGWRGQYGNVLVNQAIHFIDLAVWFFGSPTEIQSVITNVKENILCYDTAQIILKFPGNMLLNLTCSTACHESEPVQFKIFGTEGKLNYNLGKQSDLLEEHPVKRDVTHFIKKITKVSARTETPSLIYCQLDDFVNAIINGSTPAVTVKEAFEVLKIIDICEKQNGLLNMSDRLQNN